MATASHPDHTDAAREQQARDRLLDAGARQLPRPPWSSPGQPPQSVDLIRHLLWRAGGGGPVPAEDVVSALTLLPSARSEIDQMEAALLFVARAEGLPWGRIAEGLGLSSRQAAQQRFERVACRLDGTRS
ncbi:MAG TPA: hypothetical protein VK402_06410 [Blastococcus sp.]|nr:hypothetical protein [Blastococcus sp.]